MGPLFIIPDYHARKWCRAHPQKYHLWWQPIFNWVKCTSLPRTPCWFRYCGTAVNACDLESNLEKLLPANPFKFWRPLPRCIWQGKQGWMKNQVLSIVHWSRFCVKVSSSTWYCADLGTRESYNDFPGLVYPFFKNHWWQSRMDDDERGWHTSANLVQ